MMSKINYFLILVFCVALTACDPSSGFEDDTGAFIALPADQTGIHFANKVSDLEEVTVLNNYYVYNGGGVAAGDINNDGLADLFFTGNQVPCKLYLNKGDFKFDDITESAGIRLAGKWVTGVTMADINSDGFLDLYVSRSGPYSAEERTNLLYINNGDATFREAADEYGLADQGPSTQAVFFDYDRDGDLDVYIVNHPLNFTESFNVYYFTAPRDIPWDHSDKLYAQEDGRFVDRSSEAGLLPEKGFGLSASVSDVNHDGWPDLYVANDFLSTDFLWINKEGVFENQINSYFEKISYYSMGSSFGDIDNDMYQDLAVADMDNECHFRRKSSDLQMEVNFYHRQRQAFGISQYSRNMLHMGKPGMKFGEAAELAGIARSDWSWSPLLEDLDNDGWLDLLITNGIKRELTNLDHMHSIFQGNAIETAKKTADPKAMITTMPSVVIDNKIFRNSGNGTFEDVGAEWKFDSHLNSQGAVLADLNNDGWLDIVINNTDETASVYKNALSPGRKADMLTLQLEGNPGNRNGIGAKVYAWYRDGTSLYRENYTSKGYLSSAVPVVRLPHPGDLDSISVLWADGRHQSVQPVKGNNLQTITYQPDAARLATLHPAVASGFSKYSSSPVTTHHEQDFYDYKKYFLTHRLHSREGPCLSAGDINGDGMEDVFIGAASGDIASVFLQTANGGFEQKNNTALEDAAGFEDIASVLADLDGDGDLDLGIGSGSQEMPPGDAYLADRFYMNDGSGNFTLAPSDPSTGFTSSMVPIDLDGDGTTELFCGGRMVVGNYPRAADGRILKFENERMSMDAAWSGGLNDLGLVTDAVAADLDGDGKPDLAVLGEWMPLTLLMNTGKGFEKKTIAGTEGWWESIAAADVDNDGDPDIIAGNTGLNTLIHASNEEPVRLYLPDLDKDGNPDQLLTHYMCGEEGLFLARDQICKAVPYLYNYFPSYQSFAENGMDILINGSSDTVETLSAGLLASCWFENKGGGNFERHELPVIAQAAPVKDMMIIDVNSDGCSDILIAGNSNSSFYEYGEIYALQPTVLLGNCKGSFTVETKWQIPEINYTNALASVQMAGSGKQLILLGNNNTTLSGYLVDQ